MNRETTARRTARPEAAAQCPRDGSVKTGFRAPARSAEELVFWNYADSRVATERTELPFSPLFSVVCGCVRERSMSPESISLARRRADELSGDAGVVEGPLQGYHHETYVFPLPGEQVRWKCREPRPGPLWFDRRCFASEEELLRALQGRVDGIPDLIQAGSAGLQRFIEGETLGALYGSGSEIPSSLAGQIVSLFGQLARVRPDSLIAKRTCTSDDRAAEGDTARFLERLVLFTEERVYLRNMPDFKGLFYDLGLDGASFGKLREHVSGLTRRPFCLLHADLHRENFVVDGAGRLWTIDWELAMFGDPLYDLATHLYLMRYPKDQERRMTERWCETVEDVAPGSSAGWEADLPKLLAYKRAQSVFTDVIRTALSLTEEPEVDEHLLVRAGGGLQQVLHAATEPLGIESPTVEDVTTSLEKWYFKSYTPVGGMRRP
ncbi:phosphotransferase [Streptomyces sp. NPDC051920]|uniref:phosphotransferase n=1 Tax=Streptomyces sp. NPDC051920 TaxID=3155523 RepID=UPI00343C509A